MILAKTYLHIGRVIGGDDFIESLWNVHVKVQKEGYVQVRVRPTM
jgi:hypothetical protein